MSHLITEETLRSVLTHISSNPRTTSISSIPGDRETNLLAVRELRRRGLVDGVFLDDYRRPGDAHGMFLNDAAKLYPL